MEHPRKLILYIAMSLDGFIAAPGDDLSFLDIVAQEGEDYGYGDFIRTVDTVILGRKTYEWVMKQVPEFPHADKQTYVITGTPRRSEGNIQFHTGNPAALVDTLKQKPGGVIFCDGGATVVNELLNSEKFDEIIVSVIPVLLGRGIRLFDDHRPFQHLRLHGSKAYPSGLVQLHYICKRSDPRISHSRP